ncbi:MAG: hypothetical protein O3B45_00695 [Bacteroidetes bacterium]|nr:hypothetical protein [Bacteroidota bacterium]
MNRQTTFALLMPLMGIGLVLLISGAADPEVAFHGDDAAEMRWRMGELCTEQGVFFTGSGNCVNCHAPDPEGEALVDADGHTVSPVVDWQATMMANSAKDPFWRAKVSHEGLVNPNHRESIENLCTACHAPQGFHEAHLTGKVGPNGYTMDQLLEDELGLDGIGCTACHGIDDDALAGRSNGDLPINPDNVAWGGFENPWDGLMSGQTGFNPVYGEHMRNSEVCASCHSLYNHTQDLSGEETGQVFFEQTTYLEWVNSAYNAENVQCQSCHMPLVEGGAIAATQPNWLFNQRFGKHHLVGGNAFMLKLMRDQSVALELSATTVQFDSTIARTERLLQTQTAELEVRQLASELGEWEFEVELRNLAGHKFPSGYPSRIAFVEFELQDAEGITLFHSGKWTPETGVMGRDETWEPHWETIDSEDQVQVYEMVIGDVTGAPTQVLERASVLLKDNRLPPRGFFTNHAAYDTVQFGPMAALDANFNRAESSNDEGSGSDRLTYRIPNDLNSATVQAHVTLHYLSVPARWVQDMFEWAEDSEEITAFQSMFESADRTPVVVASSSAWGYRGFDQEELDWRLAPSAIGSNQLLRLIPPGESNPLEVVLVDARGRTVRSVTPYAALQGFDVSDLASGAFFVRVRTETGWKVLKGMKLNGQ